MEKERVRDGNQNLERSSDRCSYHEITSYQGEVYDLCTGRVLAEKCPHRTNACVVLGDGSVYKFYVCSIAGREND